MLAARTGTDSLVEADEAVYSLTPFSSGFGLELRQLIEADAAKLYCKFPAAVLCSSVLGAWDHSAARAQ